MKDQTDESAFENGDSYRQALSELKGTIICGQTINSHSVITTSLWRSPLHFNRHTQRQQRLRELFDKIENIIQGKCDNRWWLRFHWNTRGDDCTMECVVCFSIFVLNWYLLYSTILKLHFVFSYSTIPGTQHRLDQFDTTCCFFFHSFVTINFHSIITTHCDAAPFILIVTRNVNSVCVNCLIENNKFQGKCDDIWRYSKNTRWVHHGMCCVFFIVSILKLHFVFSYSTLHRLNQLDTIVSFFIHSSSNTTDERSSF